MNTDYITRITEELVEISQRNHYEYTDTSSLRGESDSN